MDLISKRQARLLTTSAILVGDTLCGGVFGSIVSGVAGSIIANDAIPQHLNHIGVRLRRSGEQLANHDLTEATGFAIALIIKAIAEAGTYPNSTKKLETLAKSTLKAWKEVAKTLKTATNATNGKFDPIQETGISDLFQLGTTDYVEQTVLEIEDWRDLLQHWLCPRAKVQLPENVLQEVATQLRDKFALALREVLKADFEQGGKAFAGLTLSLLGEMRGILQELVDNVDPTGSVGEILPTLQQQVTEISQLRQELKNNAPKFQQLGQQIDSGFAAVLQELGITEANITGKITQLHGWLYDELENLQETLGRVETNTERIIEFLEQREKPQVQAISFSLDTNPPRVTHWQGRTQELATVNHWLDDENTKLGAIVGIAGMGKSTLAAKVFNQRTDFVDKLWLDLGQCPSFSIVAKGILRELGKLSPEDLQQIEEIRLTRVLINCLQRQRFLLVLDNWESVLRDEGYRDFLQQWLGECHHTEILVTTQVMPNLLQVKPTELDLQGLSPTEGAQLLTALDIAGEPEELEDFVRQVNGHPLTLRLVAGLLNQEIGSEARISDLAQLGVVDVAQLMTRLQGLHRRELVQLVAVLDASFSRLSGDLQGLLMALVVLRRGFDAATATGIFGQEVTDKQLRGLRKRGFLVMETKGVYSFPSLISEYLKFKAGDLTAAHLKAIHFYLSRLKPRPEWQTVEDVREYLEVFYHRCQLGQYETAFDVIRSGSLKVFNHCCQSGHQAAFYIIRSGSYDSCVDNFLSLRGENKLLVELYQELVTHLTNKQDWRYTASLTSLGNAYESLAHYEKAISYHQQCLKIARELKDKRGEADSLNGVGNAYNSLGRYENAISYYQQCLDIFREIKHREGEAASLNNLGNAYNFQGRYEKAIFFLKQSLDIEQKIKHERGEANSLNNLGNTYNSLRQYEEAISFLKQSLDLQRKIENKQGEADSLNNLGNSYYFLGEYEKAIFYYQQSLAISKAISGTDREKPFL
jgi:tetratricopeptide (TPR) repeat protein